MSEPAVQRDHFFGVPVVACPSALRSGPPRSAEVKRVPNAAMPGGEVLPLLGAGVGEALPLLGADVGDVCADAHGCFLVGPADPKAARFTDVSAS